MIQFELGEKAILANVPEELHQRATHSTRRFSPKQPFHSSSPRAPATVRGVDAARALGAEEERGGRGERREGGELREEVVVEVGDGAAALGGGVLGARLGSAWLGLRGMGGRGVVCGGVVRVGDGFGVVEGCFEGGLGLLFGIHGDQSEVNYSNVVGRQRCAASRVGFFCW